MLLKKRCHIAQFRTEKIDSIEVRKPWHIARAFFERDGEDEEIQRNMEERQTTISKKEAALH